MEFSSVTVCSVHRECWPYISMLIVWRLWPRSRISGATHLYCRIRLIRLRSKYEIYLGLVIVTWLEHCKTVAAVPLFHERGWWISPNIQKSSFPVPFPQSNSPILSFYSITSHLYSPCVPLSPWLWPPWPPPTSLSTGL